MDYANTFPRTDTVYRNAKGKEASYRIGDGGGLFLLVDPDGSKRWRWQFARPVTGRRNTLSLGDYPTVTLAQARLKRDDALRLLAEGNLYELARVPRIA